MRIRNRTRAVLAASLAAAVLGVANAAPASAVPFGKIHHGKATPYGEAGFGACGDAIDASTQMLVAVPTKYWTAANPNHDPLCHAKVKVTFHGKTITVPVKDKCPGCGPNQLDLSMPAFSKFADPSRGVIHKVKWKFVR